MALVTISVSHLESQTYMFEVAVFKALLSSPVEGGVVSDFCSTLHLEMQPAVPNLGSFRAPTAAQTFLLHSLLIFFSVRMEVP